MRALPYLALAMAALAGLLLNASRWLYASGTVEPGDDTPFNLMVSVPVVLLVGVSPSCRGSAVGDRAGRRMPRSC